MPEALQDEEMSLIDSNWQREVERQQRRKEEDQNRKPCYVLAFLMFISLCLLTVAVWNWRPKSIEIGSRTVKYNNSNSNQLHTKINAPPWDTHEDGTQIKNDEYNIDNFFDTFEIDETSSTADLGEFDKVVDMEDSHNNLEFDKLNRTIVEREPKGKDRNVVNFDETNEHDVFWDNQEPVDSFQDGGDYSNNWVENITDTYNMIESNESEVNKSPHASAWIAQNFDNWETELEWKSKHCEEQRLRDLDKASAEYQLIAADCGLGHDIHSSPAKVKNWTVVFYSSVHNGMTMYTGCATGGRGFCPLSPQCRMIITDKKVHLEKADVVVVYQKEPQRILDAPFRGPDGRPYRVLLWREALWQGPHYPFQRDKFDFEMGTHHTASVLNPHWLRSPSDLLSGRLFSTVHLPYVRSKVRKGFSMSIISNCEAPSMRDYYLRHLELALGPRRVHRYGACGNRQLPPRPISNAARLIAQYKFYLSFENTIQEGYVTEKLLETLTFPVLPVYYGAPGVPNITTTPSFIKASDFRTPKALAEYLLYLDANPEEYNKYHEWRTSITHFDEYYLKTLQDRVAGPIEIHAHKSAPRKDQDNHELNFQFLQRRAQCCRLCDENLVKQAKRFRTKFVPDSWKEDRINRYFFSGTMYDVRP